MLACNTCLRASIFNGENRGSRRARLRLPRPRADRQTPALVHQSRIFQHAPGGRHLVLPAQVPRAAHGGRLPHVAGRPFGGDRPLAPRHQPRRRRTRAARRGQARRGPERPPGQAADGHRPWARHVRAARLRARRWCPALRRGTRASGARRARRGPAPDRRKALSVTDRIRLNEGNRRWWTLAAMCFALFMIMLDNTVVNVALPSIQEDLGASLSGLEWTVNVYTLTFAVLLVTGGRLGDILGRRRMFLFGVVVFALSSAAIGLAPDQGWLIAGRAIQGAGAAFMMPATLSIITVTFPPNERGKAIGTWAGVSALALAIGPVVGGALTEYVSWRAIFFLNLPVAVGAVAVTLFSTHESRDESVAKTLDLAGIVTISAGLTALVLALIEGNSWGWSSLEVGRASCRERV